MFFRKNFCIFVIIKSLKILMFNSIKAKSNAILKLKDYNGLNPYILKLKKDVILKNKVELLTEYGIEYVEKNIDFNPLQINKTIKIADWFGEKLQNDYNIEFTPKKLKILVLIGETRTIFHCLILYRQNMEPMELFIPKKAILGNFLLEDYHNLQVDFNRYDTLSSSKDPNRKLREHQKEAVQFLLSRKKCVLADDPGFGKSTELAVAAIEGNFDSILIISPASIKTTWKKELLWYVPERDITIIESPLTMTKSELEKFLGYKENKSGLSVKELQEEAKNKGKWEDNKFVIVNFDILDEFYQIPKSRSKENLEIATQNSPMLQYILNKKSLIIIDEAHRLSNNSSIRYKIIDNLIKRGNPDSVYLATGTPITNNPQNFYCLLKLINDPITDDWQYFMDRYCGAMKIPAKGEKERWTNYFLQRVKKNSWYDLTPKEKDDLKEYIKQNARKITITKDATNIEELRDRVSHIYLRRVKSDLTGMVKKRIHELYYDLTTEQTQEYNKLWDEYESAQMELDPTKDLNKDLLEGSIYRRYLSNEMVPYTIKLANKFIENDEKVVIGCCYDEELYRLKEYYGDKCVIYNGKMGPKEKDKAQEQFMTNPDVKILVGNLQSAGVGLTLTVAKRLIFNDFSYVKGDNDQFMDRIHRINQTQDVDIYFQIFRNTQYQKMWDIVMRKGYVIDQIIKKEDEK